MLIEEFSENKLIFNENYKMYYSCVTNDTDTIFNVFWGIRGRFSYQSLIPSLKGSDIFTSVVSRTVNCVDLV